MATVTITINGIDILALKGESVLDAAKRAGIHIPSLCYLNMHELDVLNRPASCRICMVEQAGNRKGGLVPACATFVSEGMVIHTNSKRALSARRTIVELMLSDHPTDCLICDKNLNCELQTLAADLGIRALQYAGAMSDYEKDTSSHSIVREPNKCVLCRRCETVCSNVQSVGVLSALNRGFETFVGTAFNTPLTDTECTFCGQCAAVCPTGALVEANYTKEVWAALSDPEQYVVVQTAPAIRAALGELFGMPAGESVTGKMVAALRRLGFDQVFDTSFTADVTILEESAELLSRVQNGGKLPLITSCCPAWIKFIEHQFPDLLDYPSTCKSPQEMLGVLSKTYLAEKLGIDPSKIVCVSIMPCLSKKFEARREELQSVDYVLSTRELGRMIKEAGLLFSALPDEAFDSFMGTSSGAANIFGTTGGVLEAVLRTSYERLTGNKLSRLEFEVLRGIEGAVIKEASIDMNGTPLKVAVAHELRNARKLLEEVRAGTSEYHAIEIMACPGGCIAGGGQPYHHSSEEIIQKRRQALYTEDKNKLVRRADENAEVQQLYAEFLNDPEKVHELLHTEYVKRSV